MMEQNIDIISNPLVEPGIDPDSRADYGTKRHSGRYPWGSGEDPYQHSGDFAARVQQLRKQGLSETEVAKAVGCNNTSDLRVYYGIAMHEQKQRQIASIKSMQGDGYSNSEIAKKLGLAGESTVRSMLKNDMEERLSAGMSTANKLKDLVDEKGFIDVSKGAELELGVSRTKMEEALTILNAEGYEIYNRGVANVTSPGKQTITTVLCKPGTTNKEVYNNEIHPINDYVSYDDGDTFHKSFYYPESLDVSRLKVRYAEEGGVDKDGVIEVRRGVPDLDLQNSHYAQGRIMVNGTHYLKGMVVYGDDKDFPPGVDVIFNTNKHVGKPVIDTESENRDNCVLKPIKSDPDNPFGSLIKEHGGQSFYDDPNGKFEDADGKKMSLSLINKRADEGDWGEWAKTLPSQMLSKQNKQLIDRQLGLTIEERRSIYDGIMAMENPTVKKKMLEDFADNCDKMAEELKATALPRQKYQVILPLTTLRENECYAPNYNDGEQLALIRYPHAGTFEIPIVTVNNKNYEGRRMITPQAKDAIGITSKTAEQLSGADFDGDTVVCIPLNGTFKIDTRKPLEGLKGFDPKAEYGYREGMKVMSKQNTQIEMGKITNLITDMSLRGAPSDEMERAVKHSMVVIDAAKHKLDYRRSYEENNIKALIEKYQAHADDDGFGGASTLISKAGSVKYIDKRVGSAHINEPGKPWYDPDRPIGAKVWKQEETTYEKEIMKKDPETGKMTVHTGRYRTQKVQDKISKMAYTDDARTLISVYDTPEERAYANFANELKSMANTARIEITKTGNLKYSPDAAKTYKNEVSHLMAQLNAVDLNAPREREAQRIANNVVEEKKKADPSLSSDKAMLKKVRQQAIVNARLRVGAKGQKVDISDKEWEAIQAGAISENKLSKILSKADPDRVKELASPRKSNAIPQSQQSLIATMAARGYTNAEIADRLGVSTSTVSKYAPNNDSYIERSQTVVKKGA